MPLKKILARTLQHIFIMKLLRSAFSKFTGKLKHHVSSGGTSATTSSKSAVIRPINGRFKSTDLL
jgi:hypothetical protein